MSSRKAIVSHHGTSLSKKDLSFSLSLELASPSTTLLAKTGKPSTCHKEKWSLRWQGTTKGGWGGGVVRTPSPAQKSSYSYSFLFYVRRCEEICLLCGVLGPGSEILSREKRSISCEAGLVSGETHQLWGRAGGVCWDPSFIITNLLSNPGGR